MGHRNIRTTMIYTHALNRGPLGSSALPTGCWEPSIPRAIKKSIAARRLEYLKSRARPVGMLSIGLRTTLTAILQTSRTKTGSMSDN